MKRSLKMITFVLLVAMGCIMVAAIQAPAYASAEDRYVMGILERDVYSEADKEGLLNQLEEKEAFLSFLKKQKSKTKDHIRTASEVVDSLTNLIPSIKTIIKDIQDGGDFDTAALLDTISSVYSMCLAVAADAIVPGLGSLCTSIMGLRREIFKCIMGGEGPTSENAQMMDSINQNFEDIRNRLSNIDEAIAELSGQIDAATQRILNAIPSMLDDQTAKEELGRFMSMGEGNFSYSQYRNYLYGTIENNPRGNTAYYALLNKAYEEESSDRIIKIYQDNLYEALSDNRNIFYDYINPDSANKDSIIKTYYRVVSANPQLLKESGDSPEFATVKFAYDLYQTMIMADNALRGTILYQMQYLDDDNVYCTTSGKNIPLTSIKTELSSISAQEEEIYDRIVCEIADVLGMLDSFIVESKGEFYYMNASEDQNSLLKGQTVYLNKMDSSLCDLFGLEESSFCYVSSKYAETNGIFAPNAKGEYVFDLNYCTVTNGIYIEKKIGSIRFVVGDETTAMTGSGTIEDPYLISTAQQFDAIRKEPDKHYKLIKDIDFSGYGGFDPIGYYVNTSGNEAYKEFTGSINGSGFKISNLEINGNYSRNGIIAKLGERGVVTDLTVENVKIVSDISSAKISKSKFYTGIIAAENEGTIKFCNVTGENNQIYGLFFTLNNEIKNRCIEIYAGGICGLNKGIVSCCQVNGIGNEVESTHNFGGDATEKNTHSAYVGGLVGGNAGYILYSLVGSSAALEGIVKSIYNPQTTVNPYLTVCCGGVCGVDYTEYVGIEKVCSLIGSEQISCQGILDCQSLWGRWYNKTTIEKHCFIPGISEGELSDISASEGTVKALCANSTSAFSLRYPNETNVELDNGAYSLTTEVLKKAGLQLLFDGVPVDFTLLQVYDFDGRNEYQSEMYSGEATLLLCVTSQSGQTIITKQTLNYRVAKNEVRRVTVTPDVTSYYTGDELSLIGAQLHVEYIVGSLDTNITNSTVYTVTGFSTDTVTGFYKDPAKNRSYTVTYAGVRSDPIKYYVHCEHLRNNSILETVETVPATCCKEGYTLYRCEKCGAEIKKNYTPITNEHKIVHEPGKDPTCYEPGYSGRVYCAEEGCSVVFEERYEIPKMSHHMVKDDEDAAYHHCDLDNCIHREPHQYQITQSVEKVNGRYYYVYDYVCDCGDKKRVIDTNTDVESNRELPTVVVSNGYALNGDDEVVVYVQLINSKEIGISSANLGIKYDSKLVLLEIEDGPVFRGSWITDSYPTENGYNFVWGNAGAENREGNLLKLVFKVPHEFREGESFGISVVYDITDDSGKVPSGSFKQSSTIDECLECERYRGNGGFVTEYNKKEMFVTIGGSITFVKHLPGDVNCDNVVDILDATELGKHIVGKVQLSETVADLDLDGTIDVVDLSLILQTLNGGYGTSLSNPTFDLLINLNGAEESELNGVSVEALKNLVVSVYGDESGKQTYAEYGLFDLERTGYKFDGWYTRIAIDESKDTWEKYKIELGDDITYDSLQKKQTLYAHWTINQIDFDVSDATSGAKESAYYIKKDAERQITDSDVKQEYTIVLQDAYTYHLREGSSEPDQGNETPIECFLSYKIICWKGDDGKYYTFHPEKAGMDYLDDKGAHHALVYLKDLKTPGIGKLALEPVWDDGELGDFDLSQWDLTGYKIDSVRWYKPNNNGNYIIYDALKVSLEDHEKLKALAKLKEDKCAYLRAKFDPITYTINFVVNGNEGSSLLSESNHTVEKRIAIASAESLQKTGYKLPIKDGYVWKDCYGNKYKDKEQVGYISYVNDGDTVTFYAQWEPIVYSIEYDLDGGDYGENNPVSAEYDKSVNISLPTREGYTFSGWRISGWQSGAKQSADDDRFEDITDALSTYVFFRNLRSTNNAVKFTATWTANRYTLRFDNSKGGLLVNGNKSSKVAQTLGVDYDAAKREYALTAYDPNDSYCTIDQAVYLVEGRDYYIHVNPTFSAAAGRLQIFYGINRNYIERRSFFFATGGTQKFTADQTGVYSIRFDIDYCSTATLKDFWISDVPSSKEVIFDQSAGIDYEVLATYKATKNPSVDYFRKDNKSPKVGVLCKEPGDVIFTKSTGATVTFDQNGGSNGTSSVTVIRNENGITINPRIIAPSRSGYIFAGYYANSGSVGSGVLYWIEDQETLEVWENITLYAHWISNKHSLEVYAAGKDKTYSSKNNNGKYDEVKWTSDDGVSADDERLNSSGYSAGEIKELKAAGYDYMTIKIERCDIYVTTLSYEWIALGLYYDGAFRGDINVFKVDVDNQIGTGKWAEDVSLTSSYDISYFASSANKVQIRFGVSGDGANKWTRGYTVISFAPSKKEVSADGGKYGSVYC